jgi:hypothetical protein
LLFAENAGEVATPFASVVAVFTPPANVPLGPVWAGAVNVTVRPGKGLPWLSFTAAFKVDPKAAPTIALCDVPLITAMEFVEVDALTVTPNDFVAVRELVSITRTVKLLVPVPVGVPEMIPVLGAIVSPAGKFPEMTDQS